ncbi:hypothetical protein CHS0354_010183, partial [Potamilus streckersoni]
MRKGRVAPTGENDNNEYFFETAASDSTNKCTQPTVSNAETKEEPGSSHREVKTPEALNQVVDQFVSYEVEKIIALSLIKDD